MTRLFGCLQLLLALVQSAPRSKPFLPNADISTLLSESESLSSSGSLRKAYFNSNSTSNSNPYSARLVRIDPQDESCNVKFTLKWKTQLGSAAYSAPIIFSNAEGNKQIFLSTYYQFVEMIHAEDGSKPFSWPVSFESSSFSGSPILYDVDGDGTMDLCVVDKNANMFWIQIGEFGKYNENFHVQVPHLKVRKDWYFNLDVNSTDEQVRLSMFDRRREEGEEGDRVNRKPFAKPDALEIIEQITYPELNKGPLGKRGRRLDEVPVNEEEDEEVDAKHDPITGDHSSPEDDYMASGAYGYEAMKGFHNHRRRFQDDDAAAGFMYGNPQEYSASSGNESSYVFLPPHVLGSPALADVNGDGNIEVIMAVSYYFEKDFHADDIVPSMYIAGGIACWDLEEQDWAWMVHLDLTTDLSNFKALIYGTPTIVDLDGDGRSEVIIGTSLGLLYVLEGDTGTTKRFFPMQFHEIQAQVAVADIMGGPDLEMIVCDMGGNVVVVDVMGEVLWDIKLTGELPHTAIIGDVNGDGSLDVSVVAVSPDGSSHIWVLEGDTGLPLKGFPISLPTGAAISAPAILIDLHDYSQRTSAILSPMQYEDPALPPWARALRKSPIALSPSGKRKTSVATNSSTLMQSSGLHLLVPSFDGHLYIIDGVKGCAERIDIGDHIYSLPLIEDVDSDGYLDLLLTTLSGEALLFETTIPYHPLNAWASFPKGRMNGFTHGQQGISIPELEKRILKFTSVKGRSRLPLTFDIWDARRLSSDASSPRKYTVKITRGLHKATPLVSESFDRPGRYTIFVPVSPPESMVLIIGMTNEHGQYFEDSASVSISTRFYIWIKYLLIAPFLLLTIPILLSSKLKTL